MRSRYTLKFSCANELPIGGKFTITFNDSFKTNGGKIYASTCMLSYGNDTLDITNTTCTSLDDDSIKISGFKTAIAANQEIEFSAEVLNPTASEYGYTIASYADSTDNLKICELIVTTATANDFVINALANGSLQKFTDVDLGKGDFLYTTASEVAQNGIAPLEFTFKSNLALTAANNASNLITVQITADEGTLGMAKPSGASTEWRFVFTKSTGEVYLGTEVSAVDAAPVYTFGIRPPVVDIGATDQYTLKITTFNSEEANGIKWNNKGSHTVQVTFTDGTTSKVMSSVV